MSDVRRVLWITLGLNLLVAAGKLLWGVHAGLFAMIADGVHSALDASSNVVGLIAIRHAARPPDAGHPYGHRKLETFASFGIGILLVIACQEILRGAWARLGHGGSATAGPGGFGIMLATMAVNVFVSTYERREGKRLRSEILTADAGHTGSDILVSLTVIGALVATRLGWGWVDVAATLLIVLWIGRIAWTILRPAVSTLSDEARLDPAEVDAAARSVAGVRNVHRIRTRGHEHLVWVDLHMQVDPATPVSEAHAIAHRVEAALRERFAAVADVVVHIEPEGDPIEGLDGRPAEPGA